MPFVASNFAADEILCNLPPHTLRIDLQARRWKSDVDPDSAITDSNDNGIPIEFVLLGFTPYFGCLGMRNNEEFIRMAYVGVSPKHRLLPPRCVTTTIIGGKSSQKNFIAYFQSLYNNRINVATVITTTKFMQRSFNEKDPNTGADGAKINYNVLEFADRPAASEDETKLIEDLDAYIQGDGGNLISSALTSNIPGSNLIELPLGEDHAKLKAEFIETHAALPAAASQTPSFIASGKTDAKSTGAKSTPKAPETKSVELTKEQADILGITV